MKMVEGEKSYCYFCNEQTESDYDKFSDVVYYGDAYFDVHVFFCKECSKPKSDESWVE